MNKENTIYFLKTISLGKKTFLRKLVIVYKKNEWWEGAKSFGIWYKTYIGVGVKDRKNKEFKHFIIGLYLYNTNFWIEIIYLGNKTEINGNLDNK